MRQRCDNIDVNAMNHQTKETDMVDMQHVEHSLSKIQQLKAFNAPRKLIEDTVNLVDKWFTEILLTQDVPPETIKRVAEILDNA